MDTVSAAWSNMFALSVDVFVLGINRLQQELRSTHHLSRTFLSLIFEYFCILSRSKVSEVGAVLLCEEKEDG